MDAEQMKHATCAKVDLHFQDGALPCDVLGDCVRRFGGHPLILRLRRVLMQDLLRTPEEWKAAQDDDVALVNASPAAVFVWTLLKPASGVPARS
jgi:hypothetical protein